MYGAKDHIDNAKKNCCNPTTLVHILPNLTCHCFGAISLRVAHTFKISDLSIHRLENAKDYNKKANNLMGQFEVGTFLESHDENQTQQLQEHSYTLKQTVPLEPHWLAQRLVGAHPQVSRTEHTKRQQTSPGQAHADHVCYQQERYSQCVVQVWWSVTSAAYYVADAVAAWKFEARLKCGALEDTVAIMHAGGTHCKELVIAVAALGELVHECKNVVVGRIIKLEFNPILITLLLCKVKTFPALRNIPKAVKRMIHGSHDDVAAIKGNTTIFHKAVAVEVHHVAGVGDGYKSL